MRRQKLWMQSSPFSSRETAHGRARMGWQAEAVCGGILRDREEEEVAQTKGVRGNTDMAGSLLLPSWCSSACMSSLEKTQIFSASTSATSSWGRDPSVPAWAGWGFGGGFEEPQLPLSQGGPCCVSVAWGSWRCCSNTPLPGTWSCSGCVQVKQISGRRARQNPFFTAVQAQEL